ncbi:MAG: Peptidyl-prolyl cis-trans isomerase cyp6 [Cyphobasidiales sp. Tagirdzhanova-0007]|nr:MAG: Peptidyl-prolyl cis-trans isomerase cyp6 [Cyphobasidiales sp. Tagirdzhanova-0007]
MSVLLETSIGDIILDLEVERCPRLCENFLKLAKLYYYNYCAFFNVQKDFLVQAGDPTDTGEGGSSVWYHVDQRSANPKGTSRLFKPERHPSLKHASMGTLSMAVSGQGGGEGGCGSIFFITLQENTIYLDGKHAPFGRCVEEESLETLSKFNTEVLTDETGKPLRDVRIRHVVVLDDPFPDPEGLKIPPNSPLPTAAQLKSLRVGEDEELPDEDADQAELDRIRRQREARAQALTLEMVGDLPFADVAPPENVLFVCKLNAVTRSEDLELIFSRFGTIMSCEVIRDKKTGDSLNYAFIEFDQKEEAERAYVKMDNVLIDDRRIHVDFSQSVSKLHNDWIYQRTGGRPPPNRSSGGHTERQSSRDSPPSSRSKRGASLNGNGGAGAMVFDLDDYQYRDRRKGHDGQNGHVHSGRSENEGREKRREEDYRNGDGEIRRRQSRSRERSPRRDGHRDKNSTRGRDDFRKRDQDDRDRRDRHSRRDRPR